MRGEIIQVNTSRGGVPKRPVFEAAITVDGLEGDSWAHPQFHGGPNQAVLVIASEVLDSLKDRGFPVFAGALGENLTIRGVDPRSFRMGQQWRVGAALIELTKPRTPCSTIEVYGAGIGKAIYDSRVKQGDPTSPVWCHSGVYARVVRPGLVTPGSPIELEAELA